MHLVPHLLRRVRALAATDPSNRRECDGTLTDFYTFFSESGHMPTAIHQGDWANLLDPTTRELGPQLEIVARRWRELGILDARVARGDTTLSFYCGTGWRSSIAFLVAMLLGLRARNYDHGYYGWSRGTPVARPCGAATESKRMICAC